MGISMLVGLYTTRVVLNVLGVEDYGLYNVIGGIVALFSVLSNALVNTTSRFITVSLAHGNILEARKIFSMAFFIHLIVGVLIVILGETVGLWYLHNKLVIPAGRNIAAEWLYQFTIISAFISTLIIPYNATIIAHENINIYAIIQIIDILLKFGIVIILKFIPTDKLIFYAFLMLMTTIFNFTISFVYCKKKCSEVKYMFFWSWKIFKDILRFIGWAIVGNFSHMFYTQGINLMLNVFCGPAVNAARGIAVQVEGAVRQFANNIQTAINPQIIKSYAVNEMDRMYFLIIASSRLCFYLLFAISLPIFIETEFLLKLWLGNVPDHTVNFVRIILISVLLDTFVNPMFTANLASGKLAIYHGTLSVLMYGFMFITYFTIKSTHIPESVFLCYLTASIIGYIMKIFIMNYQIGLKPKVYTRKMIVPVVMTIIISLIVPLTVHYLLTQGWGDFLITSIVSILSVAITAYLVGITREERKIALNFVRNRLTIIKSKSKL